MAEERDDDDQDIPRGEPPPPAPRDGFASGCSPGGGMAMGWGLFLTLVVIVLAFVTYGKNEPLWHGALIISGPLCVAGIGLLLRLRALKLWRTGAYCEGEVKRVWTHEPGSNSGETTTHWVSYWYEVDGERYDSHRSTAWEWKAQHIWVVYDRKNPARSIPSL